ncbi:hypothetical protein DFH06DRAFT_1433224 [Mycena polygramma]|nr:hypothetical protein DFH06DRAFT_1433224 [Mycena polygramma]
MDQHPTRCLGEQPDGRQCPCLRFTKKPNQREEDPDICKNCNHIESAHPLPLPIQSSLPTPSSHISVADLVKDFRDAGKVKKEPASTSDLKASTSAAHAETSDGLRKKRKSDTDTEPLAAPNKKAKGKGKGKATPDLGKKIFVNEVILKPEGLVSNGKGGFDLAPAPLMNGVYTDILRAKGLAHLAQEGKKLGFYKNSTPEEITAWLKVMFPLAMKWLEEHPFEPEQHESGAVRKQVWRLCIKARSPSLSLSHEPFPSGVELASTCVTAGRSAETCMLIFTSKREIPAERYEDWGAESDDEMVANSSDVEATAVSENEETPKKIAKIVIKREAITKAFAPAAPVAASGRIATRLSTGSIKKTAVYVPDSDDEDYLPSSPFFAPTSVSGQAASTTAAAGSSRSTVPIGASPLFSRFASPSPPTPLAGNPPTGLDLDAFNALPSPGPGEVYDTTNEEANDTTHWSYLGDSPDRNNTRWAAAAFAAAMTGASSSGAGSATPAVSRETGIDTSLGFRTAPRPDPWA